ncbi:MAG: hypothetical protein VXZ91_00370 [Pseudomonadota bacterium]|nr:hypothetical protein [Pseudomonadota bacterium]
MTPALLELLKLDTWKLGLAAWVFAGYSPLLLKEHGKVIRLKDEKKLFRGTSEFSKAEQQQLELQSLLCKKYSEILDAPVHPKKDQFLRNQIVDEVTNGMASHEKIHIWWLDVAIQNHFVPAYIKPEALQESVLAERGFTTYLTPGGKLKAEFASVTRKNDALDGEVELGPLFEIAVSARGEFYEWLQSFILAEFQYLMPETQVPLSGCKKHGHPRPKGKQVRNHLIDKYLNNDTNEKSSEIPSLLLELDVRIDKNSCICYLDESPYKHKKLTPAGLTERLSKWFKPTELGHQYNKATTIGDEQFLDSSQEELQRLMSVLLPTRSPD